MKKLLFIIVFGLLVIESSAQMSGALHAYTKARMKAVTFTNYTVGFLYGDSATSDIQVYIYDPTSNATPDDSLVIIPNSSPSLGRWLLWNYSLPINYYTGTTDGNGEFTVTYPIAYTSTPVLAQSFETTNPRDVIMVTASSTTGFTVQVQRRVDVLGLLPSYSDQSGVTVNVLVMAQ